MKKTITEKRVPLNSIYFKKDNLICIYLATKYMQMTPKLTYVLHSRHLLQSLRPQSTIIYPSIADKKILPLKLNM